MSLTKGSVNCLVIQHGVTRRDRLLSTLSSDLAVNTATVTPLKHKINVNNIRQIQLLSLQHTGLQNSTS